MDNILLRTKIKLTYTIICCLLLIFSQIANRCLNSKYIALIGFIPNCRKKIALYA